MYRLIFINLFKRKNYFLYLRSAECNGILEYSTRTRHPHRPGGVQHRFKESSGAVLNAWISVLVVSQVSDLTTVRICRNWWYELLRKTRGICGMRVRMSGVTPRSLTT